MAHGLDGCQKNDQAMNEIKSAFRRDAFAIFNNDWATEVTVDASPVGLGVVLAQYDPTSDSNTRRIVTCASRRLTETERRYSQVEKEALVVVWACEKLRLFLFGHEFKLIMDNRAVELIFGNLKREPPLRIKRWVLRLAGFRFTIVHKPGSQNIADYMSRQPVSEPEPNISDEAEEYSSPKAITRHEIASETPIDRELNELACALRDEPANDPKFREAVEAKFERVRSELCVTEDGIVMRGSRILLPETLQARVLRTAHKGHQGRTKIKALLRTKIWF